MANKKPKRKRGPMKGMVAAGSANKLEEATSKNKIAEILKRRPGIRQSDIAAMLGLTKGRVSQLVKQIAEEWKVERLQNYEIDLDRSLREIDEVIRLCKGRLSKCKSATRGSRWVEMWLKGIAMRAKMLGLNAPDVHEIRAGTTVDKEQRDAVAKAMRAQHGFSVSVTVDKDQPALPGLDGSDDDIIDIVSQTEEIGADAV